MPQQTPVWYELRDDVIYLNTRAGRLKERNLRRDPRASLCIVDGERYVTVRGRVELRPGPHGFQGITALSIRYHGPEEGTRRAEQYRGQDRIDCYLTIEHVHASV
jgi:PPOX class probable F420-dependent enzyme